MSRVFPFEINIGIIGTRRRDKTSDYTAVENKFKEIAFSKDVLIVSGGCKQGGDRFARVIAKKEGHAILDLYPCYKKHGSPAALFVRNSSIALLSDVIIACVVKPEDGLEEVLKRKRGGTEDTLRKFVKSHPEGEVYLV